MCEEVQRAGHSHSFFFSEYGKVSYMSSLHGVCVCVFVCMCVKLHVLMSHSPTALFSLFPASIINYVLFSIVFAGHEET